MKKVIFGLFVVSMFALASCGGPSDKDVKSLDSLNQQLDKALNDLNTTKDSTTAKVDSTKAPSSTVAPKK